MKATQVGKGDVSKTKDMQAPEIPPKPCMVCGTVSLSFGLFRKGQVCSKACNEHVIQTRYIR